MFKETGESQTNFDPEAERKAREQESIRGQAHLKGLSCSKNAKECGDLTVVPLGYVSTIVVEMFTTMIEEMEKEIGNEQSHWIDHGDGIGHPHETDEDFGWNKHHRLTKSVLQKYKKLLQ